MDQRKIIVTGASSGIGAATTRVLRATGATVIGIDRAQTSEADRHIVADLSTPQGVTAVIARLEGQYDGLCNIAGVPGTAPREAVMAVNVLALRELTASVLPMLRPGSAVVNLASQAGHAWQKHLDLIEGFMAHSDWNSAYTFLAERLPADVNVYSFSKECVIVLTQLQAAQALSQGVRVNAVSPGPVDTPILADFRLDLGPANTQGAHDAVGRWGTPTDIAVVIRALLDQAQAGWVNGVNLPVDGGLGATRFATTFEAVGS